jgi:hypothetical protein
MCGDCRTHLIETPVRPAPLEIRNDNGDSAQRRKATNKSSGIGGGTVAHGGGYSDVVRIPVDKSVILSRAPGLSSDGTAPEDSVRDRGGMASPLDEACASMTDITPVRTWPGDTSRVRMGRHVGNPLTVRLVMITHHAGCSRSGLYARCVQRGQ